MQIFHQGTFIKRYKRFFADVISSETSLELTLHCPNTGAMTGLLQEGSTALYSLASPVEMEKRKTPGTLEALRVFVESDQRFYWVGVNTHRANQIALQWLERDDVREEFSAVKTEREIKLAKLLQSHQSDKLPLSDVSTLKTRVDFVVHRKDHKPLLIEVKSATLYENQRGYFPDAVSTRASQQLRDLIYMKSLGFDVLILYVSQHEGINEVVPAGHIDSEYQSLVLKAQSMGIECRTLGFDGAFYGISV